MGIVNPTVTVNLQGTSTKATLFSDNSGTSLANPLTGDARGNFFFYAADARYDVVISGGTPSITTFTIADIELFDATVGDTTDTVWQVDTATIGVLNGVLVLDGDKYPQTEAGINSAISDASAGDTVFLPAATYSITTGITISKQIRLTGTPAGRDQGGGTILSGSGITILKLTAVRGAIVENLHISDPTGNASTIGIDLDNGATGMGEWRLQNLLVTGITGSKLGTGIRLVSALRGSIINCNVEFWIKGISFNANGGPRSNANYLAGNSIRENVKGIVIETGGASKVQIFGGTSEGNLTGLEINDGNTTVVGVHFENNAVGTATEIHAPASGGGVVSIGNNFQGADANRAIVVDSGNSSLQTSFGDTFGIGITHNGSGNFMVDGPTQASTPTIAGTGRVVVRTISSIAATNLVSVAPLSITGFPRLNINAIRNDSGNTDIQASSGNDIRLVNFAGTAQWTMADSTGALSSSKKFTCGEGEIDGDLNHDGSNVGFFGVTPADRPGTTEDIKDGLTTLGLLQGTSATPLNLDGGVLTTPVIDPLEGTLSNVPRWIFKQVDFGDMTASATADTFTLWTFPANTMIHDIVGTVVTGWSGGSISAAVASVGTNAGAANDLTLDDNFFAAATVYELHDATASGGKGALLFDATDKFAPHMFVAGGVVEIQMDLTGDNHVNATAGQARIYALVSQPLGNTTTEAN